MIVQFSFENFKSFKEMVEFTAYPINSDKKNQQNIINLDLETNFIKDSDNRLLKQIAIYGANASGKSNFINALFFIKNAVLFSHGEGKDNPILSLPQFRLVENWEEKPSSFQIVFITNKTLYTYGFIVKNNKILEEWLYRKKNLKKSKDVCIFKIKENQLIAGSEKIIKLSSPREILSNKDSSLFLSILKLINCQELEIQEVLHYFENNIYIYQSAEESEVFGKSLLIKEFNKKELGSKSLLLDKFKTFIKAIDTRIQDLKIIKVSNIDVKDTASISEFINDYKIKTMHYIYDSNGDISGETWLDLAEESNGTQKLIDISLLIIRSILNPELVLVLDEFDSKIHPLIFKDILKLYSEKNIYSQIIFATHNTSILDNDFLRRDQIYFVEKNYDESSEMYSLSDFKNSKVRNDESYERRYLLGLYQGVPIVDFTKLHNDISGDFTNDKN